MAHQSISWTLTATTTTYSTVLQYLLALEHQGFTFRVLLMVITYIEMCRGSPLRSFP